MKAWAEKELQYAQLGDERRKKRLIRIVTDLAAQPNASVAQASGGVAATQAAYEFWKSPYIKPEAIASSHQKSTLERVKQQSMVIAIQDTTELNFTHYPSKRGMGYLDNAKASDSASSPLWSAQLRTQTPSTTGSSSSYPDLTSYYSRVTTASYSSTTGAPPTHPPTGNFGTRRKPTIRYPAS